MSSAWIKEFTKPDILEGRTCWFGTIARDITALDEKAWVVLPEWHSELQAGPCFWEPRSVPITPTLNTAITSATLVGDLASAVSAAFAASVIFPQRGNRCLVQFDNRKQPWIIAWWPFNN